ncbi:carbon-nitrogen hydrolase family protein [Oscillatoria sp. CS-180]|uniref:carbon-nitrogen hydrolase family protein n=1 Tax=Oscillatoria sp. CS-180 TaxID=3021720 RepID=UPI00232E8B7A|nr:carbon-nitrogen hydrolase family protein [Oscillatoria sp. CS-180]MDB9528247.1 carbon-nitrogen hydrolase family protein [Oscillatoria sp. CS-180]
MRICVVQTKPTKGDIAKNIEQHKFFLELAIAEQADLVIFPELSLTGYEPSLAEGLAMHPSDRKLDEFQAISDAQNTIIGVGVPTRTNRGVCISLVLFQPEQERRVYSKQYLHSDEEPFFVKGQSFSAFNVKGCKIALAICYELSISDHAEQAHKSGAQVYVASVAKTMSGVEQASERLIHVARQYSIPVLMSNCIGLADDFESAGHSSIWNREGTLIEQLDSAGEGILIYDTNTQSVTKAQTNFDPTIVSCSS